MMEKIGIDGEHRVLPAIWAGATALQLSGMDSRLYGAAKLLAAAKMGALKVEDAPTTLMIDNCAYDYVASNVRCPIAVYSAGEVPAATTDAALAELRRGPAAAGTIILWNGRYIAPAPVFRKFVNNIISSIILNNIESIIKKSRMPPTATATVLAAVEVGSWIAVVHANEIIYTLSDDIKHNNVSLSGGVTIEAVDERLDVFLPRYDDHIAVSVTTARPPRARERDFNVAFNKWYKRAVSTVRLLPYQRY